MSMTIAQARDQITEVFATAWAPTGHPVLYSDKGGDKPSGSVAWARFTLRHATGGQASLASHDGRRRWRRAGTAFVQIFTPSGDGLSLSDALSKIALDAFEGESTSGGAWFRNARAQEVGESGDWFQVNVIVDFEYDEVK